MTLTYKLDAEEVSAYPKETS